MDYQLEQWINGAAGANGVFDGLMVALARWSEIGFIALVAAWFVYGIVRRSTRDRAGAVAALLASGLALALAHVLSIAWDRPRPFIAHPARVHLLMSHSADGSFPSDHVSAAVAISVVLLLVHRGPGWVVVAVAILVGYARVFAGVHYPGDVLAGALVGVTAGLLLSAPPIRRALTSVDRRLSTRLRPG